MKRHIIFSFLIIISLFACDKNEINNKVINVSTLQIEDLSVNGVTISGEIQGDNDLIINDHGFVYNLKSVKVLDYSNEENKYEKQSLGTKLTPGIFQSTLTRNFLKDSSYIAKAYATANKITTYGNAVEFISIGGDYPPAFLESIKPTIGYGGDTITIFGKNFHVGIGAIIGTDSIPCIFVNNNTLKFVSPELTAGIYPVKLYASTTDIQIAKNINFTIPELKITDVSPLTIRRGDIIKISLENRNSNIKEDEVYIDDDYAKFIDANPTYIRVRINSDSVLYDSPVISLKNGKRDAIYQSNLQGKELWKPVMKDDNFNLNEGKIAYPNKIPLMVSRQYPEEIYVMHKYNETSNNWDEIVTNHQIGKYPEVIHKNELTYIVSTYEDEQEKKYIKILSYSITTNKWKEEGHFFYDDKIFTLIAFLKDDKIYVGHQYFMKAFDLTKKTWEDKSVFPGEIKPPFDDHSLQSAPRNIVSFVQNNRCFVCASYYHSQGYFSTEFLEYNTNKDSWEFLSVCPFYYDPFRGATNSHDEQIVYITTNDGAWLLNTANNAWERYYAPLGSGCRNLSFIFNDFIYYGHGKLYEQYWSGHNEFWIPGIEMSRININDLFSLEK